MVLFSVTGIFIFIMLKKKGRACPSKGDTLLCSSSHLENPVLGDGNFLGERVERSHKTNLVFIHTKVMALLVKFCWKFFQLPRSWYLVGIYVDSPLSHLVTNLELFESTIAFLFSFFFVMQWLVR